MDISALAGLTPTPAASSSTQTTPFPPALTAYPAYSIPNPSLPQSTSLPLPSLRFPPHLREMGYGDDDDPMSGPGGAGPWRIYRPEKLPRGWDKGTWVWFKEDVDKGTWGRSYVAAESIWMVLDMDGKTPIYIHPPVCHPCSFLPTPAALSTSSTSSCDRRYPSCSRCTWETSLLPSSSVQPACSYSTDGEWQLLLVHVGENLKPTVPSGYQVPFVWVNQEGRSKRVKTSTISASEQAERDAIRFQEQRDREKQRRESLQQNRNGSGSASATAHPPPVQQPPTTHGGAFPSVLQPATAFPYPSAAAQARYGLTGPPTLSVAPNPSRPLAPPVAPQPAPPTASSSDPVDPKARPQDRNYASRLQANDLRPPLSSVSGPAPVWASRRKGLTSALEYFQNPVTTSGGTVDIGSGKMGGVARMLLLEGDVGEGYVFWGTGKSLGTLVLPLGHPRKIRGPLQANLQNPPIPAPAVDPTAKSYQSPPPPQPPSPSPIVTERITKLHPSINGPKPAIYPGDGEAPEIAAMLLAHRARTPVALAVSQDYGVVPWCVPRAFIVLGWFWISDAWPEPVGPNWGLPKMPLSPNRLVRWRFRFDWCNTGQTLHPWWETVPRNDFMCLYQIRAGPLDSTPWEVYGEGLSSTETIKLPKMNNGKWEVEVTDTEMWHGCVECLSASVQVYSGKHYCLNELCPRYFVEPDTRMADPSSTRKIILRAPRSVRRVTPQDLGLIIRPRPADGKQAAEVDPRSAGRDLWKGWCCDRCGMANERRNWAGWECEGCSQTFTQPRRIWKASELAPPLRPISTGPRLDEGFPAFSETVSKSSTIWEDGLKIVLHATTPGTEMHHALAHSGNGFNVPADKVFELLQASGSSEVPFRRVVEQGAHIRLCDVACSPFYTFLCGPVETPPIATMQSYSPMPWSQSPQVCYQGIDILNKVAGRIIDGEKEFNSLLLITMPTNMPANHTPWIPVPPFSSYAFLCLGSDSQLSFKQLSGDDQKQEKGTLTLQHGDVVMVRTYDTKIEVGLSLKGFGFFALARQVYPKDAPRKANATDGTPLESLVKETEVPLWAPLPENPDKAASLDGPELPVEEQGWRLGSIEVFGTKWPEAKLKSEDAASLPGSRNASVAAK